MEYLPSHPSNTTATWQAEIENKNKKTAANGGTLDAHKHLLFS